MSPIGAVWRMSSCRLKRAGFGGEIKQLRTEHETAGWVFLQEEPERYFGDASRIAPGAPGSLERLTWRMPQLKEVRCDRVRPRSLANGPGLPGPERFLGKRLAGSHGRRGAARRGAGRTPRLERFLRWRALDLLALPGGDRPGGGRALPATGEDGALVAEITVVGEVPYDLHANWFSLTMQGFEEPASSWQLGRVELWGLR